ncbi:MAG: hypothetical protein AVO34_02125 [Firmicutes bacterium ML8_F2]|jgi:peptidoglycan hydrolase CwlO-like protein|nr:MAG: hypothetical protein AVO34_02125 [Firmicutes bacterium ML8_F2]
MKFRIYKFFLVIFLLFPLITQGGLIDDINKQIEEQEVKRAELERQAAEYQQVIEQKKGEIKSLSNQIAIFNARINKLQVEINITKDDIDQTEMEIISLEYGIVQADKDILEQKDNLGTVIQAIAEFDQTSQMEMILFSDDFSDFFNQLTYLDNLQNGVKEKVESLRALKQLLSKDKESKEEKKEHLQGLKEQLDSQKWSLASQRSSKEILLNQTRGEEGKYQQMLANIEAQKKSLLGDINRLRQQKADELARLEELQEKPPSGFWASLSWYYRQDDSRWTDTTIGISDSQLGDYGCAISSVAMIFTYHGETITPKQLAKESIYYSSLIIWPDRWGSLRKVLGTYRTAVDWFRIDRELGAGYPVIVRVQADGYSGAHYVVVHHKTDDGRYVVHDPLFGANIYLSSSRAFIGELYDTSTSINQMIVYH